MKLRMAPVTPMAMTVTVGTAVVPPPELASGAEMARAMAWVMPRRADTDPARSREAAVLWWAWRSGRSRD